MQVFLVFLLSVVPYICGKYYLVETGDKLKTGLKNQASDYTDTRGNAQFYLNT